MANDKKLDELAAQFPEDVRAVVKVLLKHEKELSDGYENYAGEWEDTKEKLTEIAREILKRGGI